MKLTLVLIAFASACFGQNTNPCSSIQNNAVTGQVLSAATNGRTPPCRWITGGGGGGGVSQVTGTLPIQVANTTTTPVVSCRTATGSVSGCLSASDFTTFNAKVATTRAINTTSPLGGGGNLSADRTLTCTTCATSAPTNHGVALGSATQALSFTSAGSSGQCFLSGGASADPAFTTCPGGSSGLTVGTTTITSGTTTRVLFDNAGVLGEYTVTGSSLAVLNTSPTLVTPHVSTILDGNGNPFILSATAANAVDSVTIVNSSTANPATVTIEATGSDSNINLTLIGKGSGAVQMNGDAGVDTLRFLQSSTFLLGDFNNADGFNTWNGRFIGTSSAGSHDLTMLQTRLGTTGLQVASGLVVGFNSSAVLSGAADTAFSRLGAASAALGNGTAGDHTGTLRLGTITIDNSSFSFNGHTCTLVSTVVTCP